MYREIYKLWPVMESFLAMQLYEAFSSSGNCRHETMASLNLDRLACWATVRGLGGMIQARMTVRPYLLYNTMPPIVPLIESIMSTPI